MKGRNKLRYGTEHKSPEEPEVWRWVEGYGGEYVRYKVSNLGRVRSVRGGREYDMVTYPRGRGTNVTLMRGDKTVGASLLGLIAKAFLGPPPEGCVAMRKNGMITDNTARNLEWRPKSEARAMRTAVNRKAVVKIDREGNVVAVYRCAYEAAADNWLHMAQVRRRCLRACKRDDYIDGYTYRYDVRGGRGATDYTDVR